MACTVHPNFIIPAHLGKLIVVHTCESCRQRTREIVVFTVNPRFLRRRQTAFYVIGHHTQRLVIPNTADQFIVPWPVPSGGRSAVIVRFVHVVPVGPAIHASGLHRRRRLRGIRRGPCRLQFRCDLGKCCLSYRRMFNSPCINNDQYP